MAIVKRIKQLSVILTITLLVGCSTEYNKSQELQEDYANGYFTVIQEWSNVDGTYKVVYANDTGVKYFVVSRYYALGITPLYNTDGSLQIYRKK